MTRISFIVPALALALAAPAAFASGGDAWNGFRGPNGSGVSNATNVPTEFNPQKNMAWRIEMLPGYSSPVIAGDHIFLTGSEETRLYTICVDRHTGEIKWKAAAPKDVAERLPVNSPVSPTPATDGENVYVFFEACGLLSYDAEGEMRWSVELGPFNSPYGMGASPVVVDDTLLLLADQDTDAYLLALDKDTGEERWKTMRAGFTHGYATPVIYSPEDGPREIIVSGSYRVVSYSFDTGEELWSARGMAWQAKSTPVIHGDTLFVHSWMANPTELGMKKVTLTWEQGLETYDGDADGILAKSELNDLGLARLWFLFDLNNDDTMDETEWGFLIARAEADNGLFAITLGGRGDITDTHVKWQHDRALPNIPSPLYFDGVLYVLKEGGILTSLDPETGESLKAARIEGAEDPYFASPIAAGGRIYTTSQAGNIAVIEHGAEWELTHLCALEEETWATPAIANGQLIVRTQEALYCFSNLES